VVRRVLTGFNLDSTVRCMIRSRQHRQKTRPKKGKHCNLNLIIPMFSLALYRTCSVKDSTNVTVYIRIQAAQNSGVISLSRWLLKSIDAGTDVREGNLPCEMVLILEKGLHGQINSVDVIQKDVKKLVTLDISHSHPTTCMSDRVCESRPLASNPIYFVHLQYYSRVAEIELEWP